MAILIPNPSIVNEKIQKIQVAGATKLHVISDFDRTLTKPVVNGEKVASSYSRIRDGNYLSSGFTEESSRLFNVYHPIEIDPCVPLEEKKVKMQEWWEANWSLMLEHGMNMKIVQAVAIDPCLQLRSNADMFLKKLAEYNIPMLVFSSGLGDIIKTHLEHHKLWLDNMHLIANQFMLNKSEEVVGFSKPLITVFSKNEYALRDKKYAADIKDRKNVILLGDSLGDLGMSEGLEHNEIITIAFFDKFKAELKNELLDKYLNSFDIVLTDNSDFSYVNEILNKVIKK
ncbi:hypothetical protein CL619_01465 [archaeon]|nr:hypothetical protein [archaeon]|tara:strand:+ start:2721 stop:3575 length:855 start_codon:yes stop_codon:yes gene_type:complete